MRDDESLTQDAEGADSPNLEAAQIDAQTAGRHLLAEQIRSDGVLNRNQQFEICDEARRLLATVPFASAIKLQ